MSIQANFPAIKPTLLLDFANTETLDPRITFTRASTGTYYDGKTVAKAEENLQIQSQDFDNASWTKGNVTVVGNSAIAPDGTSTADTLDEGTATNYHNVTGRTAQVGTNTISVFAKNISAQYVILTLTNGSGTYCSAVYDTVAGTVANSAAAGSGYSISATSITSVGNGWYRCVMTCVMPSTGEFNIGLSSSTTIGSFGLSSYTGTSRQMFIWGAQLEQRASATAYTPTTTQPVTNYIPVLLTAASGVPRFEHNPVTGESLGLEIEEQRTNLLTYSEQFETFWAKANVTVTANTSIAPDGNLTADKLIATSTNAAHNIQANFGATSGRLMVSVYAKAAGNTVLQISSFADPLDYKNFNLATGALGSAGTNTQDQYSSITPVGNGWYRCSAYIQPSGVGTIAFSIVPAQTSGWCASFTGDNFSGIFLWGAQSENATFPTSYIPTVASQVTRAADAASMTGANFTSWYRQDEGTFYAEAFAVNSSTGTGVLSAKGSSGSNLIGMDANGNRAIYVVVNGANVVDLSPGGASSTTANKYVGAYAINNFAASVNGSAALTDTSGAIPSPVTELSIGSGSTGNNSTNRPIKKIAYYPLRVTNAQLQGLTS